MEEREEEKESLVKETSSSYLDSIRSWSVFSYGKTHKVIYPAFILLSFVFTLSGPLVNKYFWIQGGELTIPSPPPATGEVKVPVYVGYVGARELDLQKDENGPVRVISYSAEGDSPLDGADFAPFRDQIIGMRYTKVAFQTIDAFGYLVMIFTITAFGLQVYYKEFPTTLAFKVGATLRNNWKNAIPVWLIFIGACIGILRLLLVTSFVQSLATRVAIHCIKLTLPDADWLRFSASMDNFNTRGFQLDVLIGLGEWYHDAGATWSYSTYAIIFAIILNLGIFVTVFYFDTRTVRLKLNMESSELAAVQLLRNQLRTLPRHCQIQPLTLSIASFMMSIIVSKITGMMAYNDGKSVNRLPWDSPVPQIPGHPINDVIISQIDGYWFNPPSIVDGTVLGWIPMVLVIIIGSVARIDALSKVIELLAYGYWIRSAAIAVTTYPTSMAVLQSPYCYTTSKMGFFKALISGEFCNDMMYSGHATLVLTPAFVMILMLIYGPFQQKWLTISAIGICVLLSCSIVIVGRFHYTADVMVSGMICFLLAINHAPAWKVLFSYRKFELGVGSPSIDKVAPYLEETSVKVVSITKGRRIDYSMTDWDTIERKQVVIRDFIQKLHHSPSHSSRSSSKHSAPPSESPPAP